jgi:plasmid stabilization system protein ParE
MMANRLYRAQARRFLAWRAEQDDAVLAFSRGHARSVFDESPPRRVPASRSGHDQSKARIAAILHGQMRARRMKFMGAGK